MMKPFSAMSRHASAVDIVVVLARPVFGHHRQFLCRYVAHDLGNDIGDRPFWSRFNFIAGRLLQIMVE
jgi:hypothetical protein